MATPLNTVKNWFKTGLKPTQAQFWATWDSFFHKDEVIPVASIEDLVQFLDNKLERLTFENHKIDENAHTNILAQYVKKADIVDSDDNNATDKPISANQVRILRQSIDGLLQLLSSDDVSLDELQEIVDFIKLNREDLNNLTINSISGLETSLSNKQDTAPGKGLSANDFTDLHKEKLEDLNNYVRVQDFSSDNSIIGVLDGVNQVFDTSQIYEPNTVEVMLNGINQSIIDDYNETGLSEITMTEPPQLGDKLIIRYQKRIPK